MDNLENSPLARPEPNDSSAQYAALQQLVTSVLVLLLIVSGTLTIFLLRQYRSAQAEVKALNQIVGEYNKNSAPIINDFVKKLTDYERAHPDFAPILLKYGIKPGGATNSSVLGGLAPGKK